MAVYPNIKVIHFSKPVDLLLFVFLICVFFQSEVQAELKDSVRDVTSTLMKQVDSLKSEGYLNARIADQVGDYEVTIEKNERYKIAEISLDQAVCLEGFESQVLGLQSQYARLTLFDALRVSLKKWLSEKGHPFAEIQLKLDDVTGETAKLHLFIKANCDAAYKFGGWKFSNEKVRENVLLRLSLLNFGEAFNETRIDKAVERINRSTYYQANLQGLYQDSLRNLLYPMLQIEEQASSRISGLLGYNSQAKQGAELSGFAELHLLNLLGTARDFHLDFASFNEKRTLLLRYREPWLWNLPIGVEPHFEAIQEDSTYQELTWGGDVFQSLDFYTEYKVLFSKQFSSETVNDSIYSSNATQLGLGLTLDRRNGFPFTLSGFRSDISATGVQRKNETENLYLSHLGAAVEFWQPLSKRLVLLSLMKTEASLPLSQSNTRADWYSLGGAKSVQGFREAQFKTNLYAFLREELQLILDPRSRLLIFCNPAMYNRAPSKTQLDADLVWGYGAGIWLGSGAWISTLVYALNPERNWGDGFIHARIENRF